jgi:hypothetical protein
MKKKGREIMLHSLACVAIVLAWGANLQAAVIYNNGPITTHFNVCTGDNESTLQTTSYAMGTIGFGHQFLLGNRIADNFTITSGYWDISQITFYAYQTGAPSTPSPITGVYVQIWDGPPNAGGSIVWGDLTTNRLTGSVYSGTRRVTETTSCNTQRYIFANTAAVNVTLTPGMYWLDWTTDGSLASGPWASPVTILGQPATGNALQYTAGPPGFWNNAVDGGTGNPPQDFPFIIQGSSCTDADNDTYGEGCANGPDCDDNNAAVYPAATEVCNGIDDNCDNQTDEGSNIYYRDYDNDSYGDAAITIGSLCSSAPAGYAANSTDCNDNNSAVYPGATEVCGNGIDENCNGQADDVCVTTTTSIIATSTTTTVSAGQCDDADGDTFGENCSAGPDCDDTDPFLNDICPDCDVRIIPRALGWLIGDKEKNRHLLVIGPRGTQYDDETPVRWETQGITTTHRRVFLKRFMILKVSIDGAAVDKGEYRVLIGQCLGLLKMAR